MVCVQDNGANYLRGANYQESNYPGYTVNVEHFAQNLLLYHT